MDASLDQGRPVRDYKVKGQCIHKCIFQEVFLLGDGPERAQSPGENGTHNWK